MTTNRYTTTRWLVAASTLVCAAALGAQTLTKLPDAIELRRSADSPGQVVFNHSTHVDEARPDCTTCHPAPFRILKSTGASSTAITHDRMAKGELCGACHDGKKAFALDEDCSFCHRSE